MLATHHHLPAARETTRMPHPCRRRNKNGTTAVNNDIILYPTPETRRDRWGRYIVLPPSGHKPVGYTRATTVAKALDDTSSLMAWAERMTAIGLSQRPDLLAEVALAGDDKTKLNAICSRAKEHGGATVRRDLGTALHKVLEDSFNIPNYQPPAQFVADVQAVHQALRDAGLTVVAGMTERIVVLDEHQIAGTFDLLLNDNAGRTYIGDIKTGSSVTYGALAFSVQLALYSRADSLYVQGDAADGSEDIREPMPAVDQQTGIIVHVEPGSGICTIHQLQLHWELAEMAIEVRAARAMKNLIAPWQTADGALLDARNMWIRERIANCTAVDKKVVAAHWTAEILPPKKAKAYTADEIDELDVVLARIEAQLDITWPTRDPRIALRQEATTALSEAPQQPQMPDEGENLPKSALMLKEAYAALTPAHNARLKQWIAEARDAHLPIRVAEQPTARRCHIAQGLMTACTRNVSDEQIRNVLEACLEDDIAQMTSMPLGAVIGLLDHQQAATFAGLLDLVEHQTTTTGE